jgi:serine/threonine protein kinase
MGVALNPDERRLVLQGFMKECKLLRRACVHPNIVPFVGMVTDAEPLYLATEYCPGGTVHDLLYSPQHAALRTDQGGLPMVTQLRVNYGVFEALAFLATLPMIHRDVKPANILVVVSEDGQLDKVMLADFGEAKQMTQTMTVQTMAGTPVYMAPEMAAEDDGKGPKADVFSAVRPALFSCSPDDDVCASLTFDSAYWLIYCT